LTAKGVLSLFQGIATGTDTDGPASKAATVDVDVVEWRVTQAAQQRVMSQGDDVQITIDPEVTLFTIPSHTTASFVPAV